MKLQRQIRIFFLSIFRCLAANKEKQEEKRKQEKQAAAEQKRKKPKEPKVENPRFSDFLFPFHLHPFKNFLISLNWN